MSDVVLKALDEQPVAVVNGFAFGSDASVADIPKTQPTGSGIVPTLTDGFPVEYESPASSSGKYVTRSQLNGIGRLAITNEARLRLGGINTFNPDLVEISGGYCKDAVLDWWDDRNQSIAKVISLKNNNTVDFTRLGSDGYSVGPDGVNWALCSGNMMSLPDYSSGEVIMPNTELNLPTSMGYVTGVYTMPFDGFLSIGVSGYYTVPCSLFTAFDATTARIKLTSFWTMLAMWGMTNEITGIVSKFYGVLTGDVYDKCRHSLYAAFSSDGKFDVDMGNVIDGNSGNTVMNVSSSGTEGGGGCMLIPLKAGTKIRLLGSQTYSLAKSEMSYGPSGSILLQYISTVMSANSLPSSGAIRLKARIVAYKPIGKTAGE